MIYPQGAALQAATGRLYLKPDLSGFVMHHEA